MFLESVTFQFHARMLSSEVAQSLKSYRLFRTLGSRSLPVTAMLYFSGKANTSIHGLGEDDTAIRNQQVREHRPAEQNVIGHIGFHITHWCEQV